MELRIDLFGHPHYQLDRGPRTPFQGKRVAQVVGLIALAPEHGASRREIQRQVWGEATRDDDARKALVFLRQEHPDFARYLSDSPSWVQLRSASDDELTVWVDVLEFGRRFASGSYETALALVRGPLLENVRDGESRWLNAARRRWHSEVADAWHQLALQRWHEHRRSEAIELAERSVQWRSEEARATRELALLLAHNGQLQRGIEELQALLKSQRLVNPADVRCLRETVVLLEDPERELPPVAKPSQAIFGPAAPNDAPDPAEDGLRPPPAAEDLADADIGQRLEAPDPEPGPGKTGSPDVPVGEVSSDFTAAVVGRGR